MKLKIASNKENFLKLIFKFIGGVNMMEITNPIIDKIAPILSCPATLK